MSAIPLFDTRTKRRTAPRTRAVSKRRRLVAQWITAQIVIFGIVAGLTYGASCLIGHILLEQARRSGLEASERSALARKDVSTLRQRVERLVGIRSVEQWAAVREFSNDTSLLPPTSRSKPIALSLSVEPKPTKQDGTPSH